MILFYSPGACSLSEIILLEWTGEPYRLCRVTREHRKGPDYRARVNPHGQVPAMIVDGRVLTENAALLTLIADRHPDRRLAPPAGTPDRYEMYRWLSWLDSGFHVAHYPFFAPARYVADASLHETVKEHSAAGIREALGFLDRHLKGRSWMMLDRPTLLDPYVFAMARWSTARFDYAADFPAVHAHLDRMKRDDGVRFGLAVEAGAVTDPPAGSGGFGGHLPWEDAVAAIRGGSPAA